MRAPEWLWEPSRLSVMERAIYAALLRFRNHKTGLAYPAVELLGECVGVKRDTVMRALRALNARGLIETRTRRKPGAKRHQANTYVVHLFDVMPPQIKLPDEGDQVDLSDVVNQVDVSDMVGDQVDLSADHVDLSADQVDESDCNPIDRTPTMNPLESGTASAAVVSATREAESASATAQAMNSTDTTRTRTAVGMASDAQLRYLADITLMLTWEAPADVDVQRWDLLTSGEAASEIKAGWREVERERASHMLALLPQGVVDNLSDEGRSYLRRELGFLPPRDVAEVVMDAAPVYALATVCAVEGETPPRSAPARGGGEARAALIDELREAYRAARGRDLTQREVEMHMRHNARVIREDIAGLRYNTAPEDWSRPVRFFGGIVEDDTLALLVDVSTLARGFAPEPDRYERYMSYRQQDALRVIDDLTERLRLDGIAPNAACCSEVYEALSPRARAWADAGRIPDTLTGER